MDSISVPSTAAIGSTVTTSSLTGTSYLNVPGQISTPIFISQVTNKPY